MKYMLIIGCALFLGLQGFNAQAAGSIVLRGTVVDTSFVPQRPVGGLPLRLQINRDGTTLRVLESSTSTHGSFAFTAPPLPAGAHYTIIATYRGIPYSIDLGTNPAAHSIQVPVYDTTLSDASIAVMQGMVGVRRRGPNLTVIEQWLFMNTGSLTVVGSNVVTGSSTASFPLPPGARDVSVRDVGPAPASVSIAGTSVAVNAIIRPATGMNAASFHQLTYTFDIASTRRASHPTLLIETRYFIGSLKVFAFGARLLAPGFSQAKLDLGSSSVPDLEAMAVPGGSTLAVGVDGPPAAIPNSAPKSAPPIQTEPLAVAIGLGFVALLLFGIFRSSAGHKSPALMKERDRLVTAITTLDLSYQHGSIVEDEYLRLRAEEKSRLISLARQLGE